MEVQNIPETCCNGIYQSRITVIRIKKKGLKAPFSLYLQPNWHMGRIVAIDYGKKRCGIAITDPLMIIASPYETVATKDLEKFLLDFEQKSGIDEFVIGYPVTLNNKPSEAVKYINPFINRLKKIFPKTKINLEDERFTSSMAKRAMIEGGMKKSDRQDKSMADKISASLILRSYLERRDFEIKIKREK